MKRRRIPTSEGKKPEPVELRLVTPGAILFGKKCSECGGILVVPKAGPTPETCSPKCRMKKFRRLQREAEKSSL
jgi:rRNA maturation protein Nop10